MVGFVTLAKYVGVVLSKTAATFTARWYEGGWPVFEAEIGSDKVKKEDFDDMEEGIPLQWWIGYRVGGTEEQCESLISVHRVPGWTEDEVVAAKRRAQKLIKRCGFDEQKAIQHAN